MTTQASICTGCGTALGVYSARRGITRCASCAAKARGMSIQARRAGGKARAAQVAEQKRLAQLAREAGLA